MSTGVYPITESRVCMWELGNWMERVESSFLLLPQFSTLEIHRLYISMEQKQRGARRRRLRQARRRGIVPCSVRAAAASLQLQTKGRRGQFQIFWEPMLWRLCNTLFELFWFQFTVWWSLPCHELFLIRILVMNMGPKARTVNGVATSLEKMHPWRILLSTYFFHLRSDLMFTSQMTSFDCMSMRATGHPTMLGHQRCKQCFFTWNNSVWYGM